MKMIAPVPSPDKVEADNHIAKLRHATDPSVIYKLLKIERRLPEHANLAICFGSNSDKPAYIAAGLYHAGIVDTIATTGLNPNTFDDEGIRYLEILKKCGVPRSNIHTDAQAINSRRNAQHIRYLLATHFGAEKFMHAKLNVIPICASFAQLRQTMSLKAEMPDGFRYFPCGFTPDYLISEDWFVNEDSIKLVLGEKGKILKYLNQHDIAEIIEDGGAWV